MATILQISDPHLMSTADGVLKGVVTAAKLKRVLGRARQECPDPDRVILTGDLSHERPRPAMNCWPTYWATGAAGAC